MLNLVVDDNMPDLVVKDLKQDAGYAKCSRCWKYTPECGYDKRAGCENLLCNSCTDVMRNKFPDHAGFVEFLEERKRVFGE